MNDIGIIMADNSKEKCIELLKEKQNTLTEAGEVRFPRRSDFSAAEVMAIKAHLGPWPRALEAAGLKPERNDGHEKLALEKRIRSKRRRTAAKHSKNTDNI